MGVNRRLCWCSERIEIVSFSLSCAGSAWLSDKTSDGTSVFLGNVSRNPNLAEDGTVKALPGFV